MINNISQFKKWCKKGKKIRIVNNIYVPGRKNIVRNIVEVQTKGVYIEENDTDTWLSFPKASECIVDNGVIKYTHKLMTDKEYDALEGMLGTSEKREEYTAKKRKLLGRRQELETKGAIFIDNITYVWLVLQIVE